MTDDKVYTQKATTRAKIKQIGISSVFLMFGLVGFFVGKQVAPLVMGTIISLFLIISCISFWPSFKNNKYYLNKECLTIDIKTAMSEKGHYIIPLNMITHMVMKRSIWSLFEKIIAIKINPEFLKSKFPNKFITNSWDFRIFLLEQKELNEIFNFVRSANPRIDVGPTDDHSHIQIGDRWYFPITTLFAIVISGFVTLIFNLSLPYYGVFFSLSLGIIFLLKAYRVSKTGIDIGPSAVMFSDMANERVILRGNRSKFTRITYISAGIFFILIGFLLLFLAHSLILSN